MRKLAKMIGTAVLSVGLGLGLAATASADTGTTSTVGVPSVTTDPTTGVVTLTIPGVGDVFTNPTGTTLNNFNYGGTFAPTGSPASFTGHAWGDTTGYWGVVSTTLGPDTIRIQQNYPNGAPANEIFTVTTSAGTQTFGPFPISIPGLDQLDQVLLNLPVPPAPTLPTPPAPTAPMAPPAPTVSTTLPTAPTVPTTLPSLPALPALPSLSDLLPSLPTGLPTAPLLPSMLPSIPGLSAPTP